MKKALTITSNSLLSLGLTILAGTFLFGAAPLTPLGWAVILPVFIGGVGTLSLYIYDGISSIEWDKKNKVGHNSGSLDASKSAFQSA